LAMRRTIVASAMDSPSCGMRRGMRAIKFIG
jgi:hypothetical protein